MGISCRRTVTALAQLGVRPEELSAILITHEHTDHIQGLATYIKKYRTPILCSPGTARQLRYRLAGVEPLLRTVPLGGRERCGHVEITLLPTCHDCRESSAFRLDTGDTALGYLTDTGCIPEETASALLGCQLLVLESNHDVEMLRSGSYPYPLKQRVLGPEGHLSNDTAARFAVDSARQGTRDIILAHLSKDNNTPQVALNTVGRALEAAGYTGKLCVAPRDTVSEEHRLEKRICSE
jgi:phosphoribosyl 1,2-cyclic phosphodiesterase